ncbi:MAG: Nif3-like dinuclear metal center hexameric protein [Flavobacteriales bacterium]|nr:Nif3-like dinuclear metal center hexameric protein [Flavobacteriales bacterium]
MKIKEIIETIEEFAPISLQEGYDNCGLIIGNSETEVNGVLLALDCTEEVLEEAILKKINLVITHHPIVFAGLKKINGNNYIERVVIKAIKNNIAIYAAHTNTDNVLNGVNGLIAQKLGLNVEGVLEPQKNVLGKLVTFCPLEHAEKVRNALFNVGAGSIGNYNECSFNTEGIGTFKGNEFTTPFVGKPQERHHEQETRIETIFPQFLQEKIVAALLNSHPYEEVAYDIFKMENTHPFIGSGLIGRLDNEESEREFLEALKLKMNVNVIRYTALRNKPVKRVAICGGSGSFLLTKAIKARADVFISADFKYHQFFDAEGKIVIADIGHFESEQFTPEIFYKILIEKFPKFAVHLSTVNTNPINYL